MNHDQGIIGTCSDETVEYGSIKESWRTVEVVRPI